METVGLVKLSCGDSTWVTGQHPDGKWTPWRPLGSSRAKNPRNKGSPLFLKCPRFQKEFTYNTVLFLSCPLSYWSECIIFFDYISSKFWWVPVTRAQSMTCPVSTFHGTVPGKTAIVPFSPWIWESSGICEGSRGNSISCLTCRQEDLESSRKIKAYLPTRSHFFNVSNGKVTRNFTEHLALIDFYQRNYIMSWGGHFI